MALNLIVLLSLVALGACDSERTVGTSRVSEITQEQLDDLAASLDVRYTVINNLEKGRCGKAGRCFSVKIVLTSPEAVSASGWQLYFSQYFPLHEVVSDEFIVDTINGDLKRIVPNENYRRFKRGQSKELTLYLAGTHGNEFEAMPNYYVVADGLEPRLVESTVPTQDPQTGLEIMPHLVGFTDAERQFRISDAEKIEWATSSVLYERNENTVLDPGAVASDIIPTPLAFELDSEGEKLDLASGISVALQGVDRDHIATALDRLGRFGVDENQSGVPLTISVIPSKTAIPGAYSLLIEREFINIEAVDAAGAFYALQSVAGLMSIGDVRIPLAMITDQPRYGFRGIHIDVARNFHSKELILRLIEQMAAYKLNKLHFHLGDDEGWRMEIPGLPELTDVGSRRCHDESESTCLLPQLGSGPFGDSAVNGYYSVSDYQEILAAATAHHVQVIPSFDMPGHSRAAVKSMEARYRKLREAGDRQEATRYLLTDLDDKSRYNSIQNYTDNTINVCMQSSYAFVDKVVSELQEIHAIAGHPLTRYHIGADETAGAWKDSPACERFLAENSDGVDRVDQLGAYFIERVAGVLASKGIEPAGWGDGMGHTDAERMPAIVQSNAWGRLIDPAHVAAHKQVNDGWQVVISVPDATYFDFPYEADPKERGFYWASRQTNSRKVFEFMPDNLPAHAEFWTDSEGLDMQLNDQNPMQKGAGFVGLQGHFWSETLRTDEQLEYMAFPRLLALAERAWHAASWEVPYDHAGANYDPTSGRFTSEMRQRRDREWNRFANLVAGKELAKLDHAGLHYRIPTVGAKLIEGILHCNLIFPGLAIEYRLGEAEWQVYSSPVPAGDAAIEVRAVSADGKRKGRPLQVQ